MSIGGGAISSSAGAMVGRIIDSAGCCLRGETGNDEECQPASHGSFTRASRLSCLWLPSPPPV